MIGRALPLAALLLCASARPFEAPRMLGRARETPTLYDAACAGTIVPPGLLRAVARVESSERDDAIGPDGLDEGRFQLRRLFHEERAARWGAFDPFEPAEAGRIAARVLEDCYVRLGDWNLAIAAYRQGVDGVRRDGPALWYVERVRAAE